MVYLDKRQKHKTDERITPFHSINILVKVATKPNGNAEELFISLLQHFCASLPNSFEHAQFLSLMLSPSRKVC